jgi:hypothetical protein
MTASEVRNALFGGELWVSYLIFGIEVVARELYTEANDAPPHTPNHRLDFDIPHRHNCPRRLRRALRVEYNGSVY